MWLKAQKLHLWGIGGRPVLETPMAAAGGGRHRFLLWHLVLYCLVLRLLRVASLRVALPGGVLLG